MERVERLLDDTAALQAELDQRQTEGIPSKRLQAALQELREALIEHQQVVSHWASN